MIRAAKPGDEAAIEAFLKDHAETSMFLRANLASFGLSGSVDPRATTYWLQGDPPRAIYGRSNAGFLMLQAPSAGADDLAAFARVLDGMEVAGVTGDRAQVDALRDAAGLNAHPFSLDRPEPLYRLPLAAMRDPGPAAIRAPGPDDTDLLERWVCAYNIEALGAAATDETRQRVQGEVARILASGQTRLMIENGVPVAKTAFNARLADMVQIGGVYTPPELRGRGYARRAVAAHLREARGEGVDTAILFASGAPACRTYEAIGFNRIGEYALALLQHPVVVGGVA